MALEEVVVEDFVGDVYVVEEEKEEKAVEMEVVEEEKVVEIEVVEEV